MKTWVASFVLLIATAEPAWAAIPIQNATPAEQAALQKALDKLPPCFKKTLEDNAIPVKVCNGTNNAFFAPAGVAAQGPCPAQYDGKPFMQFDMTWLMNPKASGDAMAKANCLRRDTQYEHKVEATMLHEVAHAYNNFNQGTVSGFLAAGFDKKFENYRNDPKVISKVNEMRTMAITGPWNAKRYCELQYELWLIYKQKGLAIRGTSDTHSADVNLNPGAAFNKVAGGKEYFAMVAEMYGANGWAFCATLNEAEKTWWASNMAECFRQFPTPDCMKNRNAFGGAAKPGDGGVFLKR